MLVNVLHLLPGTSEVSRGYCGSWSLPCILVLKVFEHICDCNWYENHSLVLLLLLLLISLFLVEVGIFSKPTGLASMSYILSLPIFFPLSFIFSFMSCFCLFLVFLNLLVFFWVLLSQQTSWLSFLVLLVLWQKSHSLG